MRKSVRAGNISIRTYTRELCGSETKKAGLVKTFVIIEGMYHNM